MVNYPASIDDSSSIPPAVDVSDIIDTTYINKLRSAIIAIETELGVKPSGVYTTVRARLDALEAAINAISGTGGGGTPIGPASGDLADSYPSPTVVKIQNRTVASTAPTTGQALVWDGSAWSPGTVAGSGAPVDAQYLTLTTNGTLTEERVLTVTAPLALADGGAGGNASLTLADSGVGASTTKLPASVTVDAKGRITAISPVAASPAQGDVVYYNGSAWTNLGPGTSGQFLKTQGAAANPIWATTTGGIPYFANIAALKAYDGYGSLSDGYLVYVNTLECYYKFFSDTAATADDTIDFKVVRPTGWTSGQSASWLRILSDGYNWTNVSNWYIDSAGNNENDGTTTGTALQTWPEFKARLGSRPLIKNVTVEIRSDLTGYIDIDPNWTLDGYNLLITGSTTASGTTKTIISTTTRNRFSNRPYGKNVTNAPPSFWGNAGGLWQNFDSGNSTNYYGFATYKSSNTLMDFTGFYPIESITNPTTSQTPHDVPDGGGLTATLMTLRNVSIKSISCLGTGKVLLKLLTINNSGDTLNLNSGNITIFASRSDNCIINCNAGTQALIWLCYTGKIKLNAGCVVNIYDTYHTKILMNGGFLYQLENNDPDDTFGIGGDTFIDAATGDGGGATGIANEDDSNFGLAGGTLNLSNICFLGGNNTTFILLNKSTSYVLFLGNCTLYGPAASSTTGFLFEIACANSAVILESSFSGSRMYLLKGYTNTDEFYVNGTIYRISLDFPLLNSSKLSGVYSNT